MWLGDSIMDNEIKIKFKQDYKSFKTGTEYIFNGNLIVLSGINGAGKSQLLESIQQEFTDIYINNNKISHRNILKYSFRDNISLPSFGNYSYDFSKKTNEAIINVYNFMKSRYYKDSVDIKQYFINCIDLSINFKDKYNNNISKLISKATIAQIVNILYDSDNENWMNLTDNEVLKKIPRNFIIKFENDEIEGITRIFTEAARLRFLERNKYADTNEIFNNEEWLKTAPWTEINNLFEKMHFNAERRNPRG